MSKAFIPTNSKTLGTEALTTEWADILYGNAYDTLQYNGEPLMYFKHIEGDSAIKAKGYKGAFMATKGFNLNHVHAIAEFVWECVNVHMSLVELKDLCSMPNEKWRIIERRSNYHYVELGYYSDYRTFLSDSKGTPKEDTVEAATEQTRASEVVSKDTESVSKDTEGTPDKATHYKGAIEPLEVMSKLMSKDEFIGFLKGNIIKYSYRAGRKDGESGEKDRNKFLVYSDWLYKVTNGEPIELAEGKTIQFIK